MSASKFSDLPEYCNTSPPLPLRSPPIPPKMSGSQAMVAVQRPPLPKSYLSAGSQQSSRLTSVSSKSRNSSRTSLSTLGRHQNHINIGIDFGTTYSGVSWTISGTHDTSIHTVDTWPSGPHVKVPTEISYASNGTVEQWGYTISPEAEKMRWFKLLLMGDDLPKEVRESPQIVATTKLLRQLNKEAVDVTADYLKRLWEFAIVEIRQQNPRSIDGMPFRIVIGVPANWPQKAQDKMRIAAKRAGLLDTRKGGLETELEFVAEPEAAAVAAFHEGNIRYNICIGDIVVICDAGGGTVDIVTYEVTQVEPTISLGESINNDMGLCGSIFLDNGFISHMETMIGKQRFPRLPIATQGQLMDTWEHNIKRQYYHGRSEIATPIPHLVARQINKPYKQVFKKSKGAKQLNGDTMRFLAEDITSIFDPVMSDILELACKQRNKIMKSKHKKPKAIFLVGGLGGNRFLYERLQAEFATGDIEVIQPRGPNVWASISRGAAIRSTGYDDHNDDQPFPVVTSYISKAHYGMAFKEHFDSSRHTDEDRREYDAAKGVDLVWDQMRWYVSKGDDVSKRDPVDMTWEFEQLETQTRSDYTVRIFECEASIAPTRMTKDVRECAAITFTVSPNNYMYRENAGGHRCRFVRFSVKVSLAGMGKVDFALYINGKLAASRDVTVKR